MASSAKELQLGYLVYCRQHTRKQMQSKCFHNLRAPCGVTRVYLHAQTAVDAGDIRTWQMTVILIREKPEYHQLEPHAGTKMAQILQSPV